MWRISTIPLTSSYANSGITWANDPYDGNAWTQAKLNSANRAWRIENKSVGTVQDSFGMTSGGSKYTNSPNYITLFRFQATFTGTVDTLASYYIENSSDPKDE